MTESIRSRRRPFNEKPVFAAVLQLSILTLIGCALCLMMLVPVNMDEYSYFHRTACEYYPAAGYQIFRESCHAYHFRLLGFDYHQSYSYIGALQDFIFTPFFAVFHSKWGAFAYGICALGLFCALTVKAFALRWYAALVPALCFPLLYQFLHDAGPLRLSWLTFPLLVLICRGLLPAQTSASPATTVTLCAAAALICVLGTADKAFYLYTLPLYLCLGLLYALGLSGNFSLGTIRTLPKRQLWWAGALTLCCVAAPLLFLWLNKVELSNENYVSYFEYLRQSSEQFKVGTFTELGLIGLYLAAPLQFIDRSFAPETSRLILSGALWLLLLGVMFWRLIRGGRWYPALLLALSGECALYVIMQNCHHSQHFIYLHLPLVLGLMIWASQSKKACSFVLIALCVITALCTWQTLHSPQYIHSEKGREAVFDWLSQPAVASHSIINFTEWGGYYIQSLFGDKSQLVTYTEPLSLEQVKVLAQIARQTGRAQILNVCWNCSAQSLAPYFPGLALTELRFQGTHWKVIRAADPPVGAAGQP